jgi:hypothetical protein
VRNALRNGRLRRALVAFLIFNVAWWANWIAVLVWAYEWHGVRGASGVALAQLVPAAALATPAAALLGRLPHTRALTLGYLVQTVTYLALGASLSLDAPIPVVLVAAVLGSVAVTLTRPVHNSMLPEISETTGDLTVGNAASGTLEAAAIVVGPLVCGLTIGMWGSGGVVLLMAAATGAAVLATVPLAKNVERPVSRATSTPSTSSRSSRLRLVVADPAARVLSAMLAAESTLVGMIDILVVVLALDLLAMSDSGPGILNAAIGLGGLIGAAFTFVLVGSQRLAAALALSGLAAGVPFVVAGVAPTAALAAALLLVCGAGKAFFEVTARTLLQRLLPDRLLTAVFGLQESIIMAGYALGSLAAPLLVAALGPKGAFAAAGAFLPAVTIATWSSLRRLDAAAAVPADVLDLLLKVPILSVLAPRIVERMAREAVAVSVPVGSRVINEGDDGDLFYVIAAGELTVSKGGRELRQLDAGDWFGELALLRDVPRTASVVSASDAALWALDRDQFLAAVAYSEPAVRAADEHARGRYE